MTTESRLRSRAGLLSSFSASLTLVVLVSVGCSTGSTPQRPSAGQSTPSPSQVASPASTYGPVPPLVDSKATGEALLQPANFQLTCTGDTCTVAGDLMNVGGHPRTTGKMTATLVDAGSNAVLSGCEAVVRNLNPGDTGTVSCNFSRHPLLTRAPPTAQVRFDIVVISYSI
jgi:hypothetical protein